MYDLLWRAGLQTKQASQPARPNSFAVGSIRFARRVSCHVQEARAANLACRARVCALYARRTISTRRIQSRLVQTTTNKCSCACRAPAFASQARAHLCRGRCLLLFESIMLRAQNRAYYSNNNNKTAVRVISGGGGVLFACRVWSMLPLGSGPSRMRPAAKRAGCS